MSIATGRTGGANPSDAAWMAMVERITEAISADQDIFISETPPPDPEAGDVWYKPSEDRYYHWV